MPFIFLEMHAKYLQMKWYDMWDLLQNKPVGRESVGVERKGGRPRA